MFFGDANVIGCYNFPALGTGWLSYSDSRFKFNIKEEVKGLAFIMKLRPVTYQFDTRKVTEFMTANMPDSTKKRHLDGVDFTTSTNKVQEGFLAQEVEQAEISCGIKSSIVSHPSNSTDLYALSYGAFVVPLVKAVQELSHNFDSLARHSKMTDSLLSVLQNCCNSSSQRTRSSGGSGSISGNDQGNSENITHVELANNIMLYQNEPNPFGENTVIRYFIPENTTSTAYVVFYDMYGKEMQRTQISTKGFGSINANTLNLASGVYSYSMIVEGRVVDNKKMIKNQ